MSTTRQNICTAFLGASLLFACLSGMAPAKPFQKKQTENQSFAWICDGNEAETPADAKPVFRTEYWQPSGEKTLLLISPKQPGKRHSRCNADPLPFPASSVSWASIISGELAGQLTQGVVLGGEKDEQGNFRIDDASALDSDAGTEVPEKARRLPLHENLLDSLTAVPFGQEERASIEKTETGLQIECKAGQTPAGIVFQKTGHSLPRRENLLIETAFSGEGVFRLSVADHEYRQKNDSLVLGSLAASGALQSQHTDLSNIRINKPLWDSFSIVCPDTGGRLYLQSLKLEPKLQQTERATPIERSGWIWSPEAWQKNPQKIFDTLNGWQVKRVYITVPVKDGDPLPDSFEALQTFIKAASQKGISVWAVDGDRFALLPSGQAPFLNRAQAYAAYNQSVRDGEKLSGIQYDIEPYLMSGFALDAPSWNNRYREFLAAAKSTTGFPIEIALPFWFHTQKIGNRLFLDEVAPSIDGIAIMDYRTDPAQVQQLAKPYLKWGERNRKRITVALETVPLPDSISQVYRPSNTGTLWLWQKEGQAILVRLKQPIRQTMTRRQDKLFAYSHSVTSPASNVTFYRDTEHLKRLLPDFENRFRRWPSFAGMAIHGIER